MSQQNKGQDSAIRWFLFHFASLSLRIAFLERRKTEQKEMRQMISEMVKKKEVK